MQAPADSICTRGCWCGPATVIDWERLCRYALRPPLAQERLHLTREGEIWLALRHRWADGTTHVRFDPLELLERLAVLTPRARVNLILYYGVLAPRAAWRSALVPAIANGVVADGDSSRQPVGDANSVKAPGPVDIQWAELVAAGSGVAAGRRRSCPQPFSLATRWRAAAESGADGRSGNRNTVLMSPPVTTARVLLVDTDPLRRHDAAHAIAQARATPVPGAFETSGTQWAAAAVAVDRSLADGLLAKGIARMRRASVPVIPYGPDAVQWTLAARAKILIVCGAAPLDSRSPDFGPSLTNVIGDILAAVSRRDDERRRVHEIMDRLAIVGRSEQLFAVFRWVRRVAPLSDVPALITGPTGTGKELVARAIHALDPKRARGPFMPVNCAAISEHLAESELFGHRRGAFTGAERDRPGLFKAADGGVLFLDEIGELDGRIQAKILRTLQDGRVLGVGWDRDVPVSVRVLAATNRDVTTMVADGSFRGDLYHRLNATSVRLAPLVDRPEDIRPLAEHFVTRHSTLSACRVSDVGDEFVDAIRQSGLPGNVRQLENVVRRALVERDRPGPLGLGDLPPELFATLTAAADPADPLFAERSASTTLEAVASETDWNLARAMNACEALLVGAALARADGSQTRAARLLGITPRSVYNKVRRHQLPARRRA